MASKKVEEDQLMDHLTDVFRTRGFEGASLTVISEATGLQRASLYHRFPGGKEEMAQAVLERAEGWLGAHALAPLSGSGPPADRVRSMARKLDEFYVKGRKSCLLDALSMGDESASFRGSIAQSLENWTSALVAIAREAGLKPSEARRRADEALARIQGSLVLARISGDTKPFRRTLESLPDLLTPA